MIQERSGLTRDDAPALPPEVEQFVKEVAERPHPESYLIAVLHRLQNSVGYLSREHLNAVSVRMKIPAAKVTGVATFYHFFTFTPRGRHRLSICMGTACFVRGAGAVLARLQEMLGIGVGGTTADGLFSLEVARCVGACALAPVLIVNEKVYANVKPEDVPRILEEYGFDRGAKRK